MSYQITQSFLPDPGFGYAQAPSSDGGVLGQLKTLARKYCPEELSDARREVLPDDELHLEELEAGFQALLSGASPFPDLPYLEERPTAGDSVAKHPEATPFKTPSGSVEDGFGIGIPETQKLQDLNYEEVDTLNSEEIKKDFPVLNQKVN